MKGDIGVIGLAVMGQNLILNMNDKGFKVVAYNRTVSKVDDFLNSAAKTGKTTENHVDGPSWNSSGRLYRPIVTTP